MRLTFMYIRCQLIRSFVPHFYCLLHQNTLLHAMCMYCTSLCWRSCNVIICNSLFNYLFRGLTLYLNLLETSEQLIFSEDVEIIYYFYVHIQVSLSVSFIHEDALTFQRLLLKVIPSLTKTIFLFPLAFIFSLTLSLSTSFSLSFTLGVYLLLYLYSCKLYLY